MYNVYLEVLEFYPKLQQIQYAAKDRKYRESVFPPPWNSRNLNQLHFLKIPQYCVIIFQLKLLGSQKLEFSICGRTFDLAFGCNFNLNKQKSFVGNNCNGEILYGMQNKHMTGNANKSHKSSNVASFDFLPISSYIGIIRVQSNENIQLSTKIGIFTFLYHYKTVSGRLSLSVTKRMGLLGKF